MNRNQRRRAVRDALDVQGRKIGVPPTTGPVRLYVSEELYLSHGKLQRMPNRWWRFWQWALLGWHWKEGDSNG